MAPYKPDSCYRKKEKHFYLPIARVGKKSFSGTRKEGSVDCIAELPDMIRSKLAGDSIKISASGAGKLFIWKGEPSYQTF